jgi:hypothetical protein
MTKKEIIWLLIRLAGLWFLWQSVQLAIALVGNYLHMRQSPELFTDSAGLWLQMILQLGIHLALALYCLGSGNQLFGLLAREQREYPDSDSDSESTRTTLGLP